MKKRNAKELCAMLLKRTLKELNEDEEEIVVDYLEDIGIEVDIDTKPVDLCKTLLDKAMEKELGKGKKIPLTAYMNSILEKEKFEEEKKEKLRTERENERRRIKVQKTLEEKSKILPGCVPSQENILSKGLYDLVVNPEIGIEKLSDESLQYSAVISFSSNLYENIFNNIENPIIEITTSKGYKGYARLTEPHSESLNKIYVSPLVSTILNFDKKEGAFLKLCMYLPNISKVNFTYYGTKKDLENDLPLIISKLPSVVNAFSYLSLGTILTTDIDGKEIKVRVDELLDSDEKPIFAGIVPFGEGNLPFDIIADL